MDHSSLKILLIEDDRTMLSLLQTLLQLEGFEVSPIGADDSQEGILQELRRVKPDLALLDVFLRRVNGFDLLHRIRIDPELNGVRVLMSSGMDFAERCLAEGANGFILKPYMPEDLIASIQRTLNLEPKN